MFTRSNAILIATALIGSLFYVSPSQATDTLAKIKESGELLAGVRPDAPPMGYLDSNGEFQGFGVDIAKEVAKKLGVTVKFVPSNSQTRIPLLNSGRTDADFTTTTPTKEREEVVDFSIVFVWDTVVPLVRQGESNNPKDYGPPRKVSTTQGNYAINLFKALIPDANITVFPEYPDAVQALIAGKVDAVLTNRFVAQSFADRYDGKLQVGDSFFDDPQAIMVRENDSKWRKTINWSLQEMWAQGTYQDLFKKHYGYTPNFTLWSEKGLQPGIK